MTSPRQIVSEEWGKIVEEFELRPGSITEKFAARIINRLDELGSEYGKTYLIEHDGFEGRVIGTYLTLEGKRGVVLQQTGTRVCHLYGKQWLRP